VRIAALLDAMVGDIASRSTATSSSRRSASSKSCGANRRRAPARPIEDVHPVHRTAIARARALSSRSGNSHVRSPSKLTNPMPISAVFPRARELGYRGNFVEVLQRFLSALINCGAGREMNAEEGGGRYFMSAEDLTTQSGVAVQQDLALAAAGRRHALSNAMVTTMSTAWRARRRPSRTPSSPRIRTLCAGKEWPRSVGDPGRRYFSRLFSHDPGACVRRDARLGLNVAAAHAGERRVGSLA